MPKMGDWSASVDVLGQFFYILLIFGIVILLFLICARWFNSMRYAGRGRNISIIESCPVGPQSSVQIVRAGERLFLIGITKDHISLLAEITGQAINTAVKPHTAIFEKYLKKYMSPEETEKKEDGT